MPAWGEKEGGLRPDEIRAVVDFVRGLGDGIAAAHDLKPARWASGNLSAGGRLFAAYCAGCHGPTGQGGEALALNNRVLLASATDTYLAETIRRGREGTLMQSFEQPSTAHPALSAEDIEALVTFIRTWEQQP
jgi:mono/diheme cytochrome c family protein